ncbi:HPr family phosphocarrier protein [Lachnospiraceae bacterium oral taxon 500]|nr:HPr family phosphocarrier protein [Lachnospiraceae bacterium oral taxon 500]
MTKKTIEIKIDLEARQVALFVQMANQFSSKVYMQLKNLKVNAKSIMGMMSVGAIVGDRLELSADGADEAEAIPALESFLLGRE